MEDVTFVVQGPVVYDSKKVNLTKRLVQSIRRNFPKSPIVFSTWVDQDTLDVSADEVIKQSDPGSGLRYMNLKEKNNINRQILSSRAGLERVKTNFAVKVRSDLFFESKALSRLIYDLPATPDMRSSIFEHFVIVLDRLTMSPAKKPNPALHVTDMFFAGYTSDLLKIWSIQPMTYQQEYYYLNQPFTRAQQVNFHIPEFRAEQYIVVQLVKEFLGFELPSIDTRNSELPIPTEEILDCNFIPFRLPTLGIAIQKESYLWTASNSWISSIYARTFFDWYFKGGGRKLNYKLPYSNLYWEIRGEFFALLYRLGFNFLPSAISERQRETREKYPCGVPQSK